MDFRRLQMFSIISMLVASGASAQVAEPPFCQPSEFMKHEITNQPGVKQGRKAERLRVFRIDDFVLVGVGVGKSDHVGLQRMYHALATPGANDKKYCTWYFNKGHDAAERVFNHFPMSKPSSKAEKAAREWASRIGRIFEDNPYNVKKCLEEDKYLAMGCDGQKHRGPTAFGMALGYLGCSPENSEAITRRLWGLNGIKAHSRVAIAREGQKIRQRAEQRRVAAAAAAAGEPPRTPAVAQSVEAADPAPEGTPHSAGGQRIDETSPTRGYSTDTSVGYGD